jgi:hypothetical protein
LLKPNGESLHRNFDNGCREIDNGHRKIDSGERNFDDDLYFLDNSKDSSIDFSSRRDKEKDMEGGNSAKPELSPSRSRAPLGVATPGGGVGGKEETANSPEPQSAHWKEKLDIISQALINGEAPEKGVVSLLAQRMLSDIIGRKFAPSVAFKRAITKSGVSDIVAAMVSLGGDVDAGRLEGMKDPVGVFVAMLCPKRKGKKAAENEAAKMAVKLEAIPNPLPLADIDQHIKTVDPNAAEFVEITKNNYSATVDGSEVRLLSGQSILLCDRAEDVKWQSVIFVRIQCGKVSKIGYCESIAAYQQSPRPTQWLKDDSQFFAIPKP